MSAKRRRSWKWYWMIPVAFILAMTYRWKKQLIPLAILGIVTGILCGATHPIQIV